MVSRILPSSAPTIAAIHASTPNQRVFIEFAAEGVISPRKESLSSDERTLHGGRQRGGKEVFRPIYSSCAVHWGSSFRFHDLSAQRVHRGT